MTLAHLKRVVAPCTVEKIQNNTVEVFAPDGFNFGCNHSSVYENTPEDWLPWQKFYDEIAKDYTPGNQFHIPMFPCAADCDCREESVSAGY
jgi:hypothetical protein